MILSYIRHDKNFDGIFEQLKLVSSYTDYHNMVVDKEFIDNTSQSRRINDRFEAVEFLRSADNSDLIIYDIWVLSSYIEDVVQIMSCLLKNGNKIHVVKHSIIINSKSDTVLVLGLIDKLRQIIQNDAKKSIGRPKGSRSSSKFDKFHDEIIEYIRSNRSVSEMARKLGVSRSSLKDYIESRELKEVALGALTLPSDEDAKDSVINTIACPTTTKGE